MMEIRRGCELIENLPPFYSKCTNDVAVGEAGLPSYQPKITFIAGQKRHRVWVFLNNSQDGVGRVLFFTIKLAWFFLYVSLRHFCFILDGQCPSRYRCWHGHCEAHRDWLLLALSHGNSSNKTVFYKLHKFYSLSIHCYTFRHLFHRGRVVQPAMQILWYDSDFTANELETLTLLLVLHVLPLQSLRLLPCSYLLCSLGSNKGQGLCRNVGVSCHPFHCSMKRALDAKFFFLFFFSDGTLAEINLVNQEITRLKPFQQQFRMHFV